MSLAVEFELVRETKGAVRYEEPAFQKNEAYAIGVLYVRKSALGAERPPRLTVNIDWPKKAV